jgi:acylphosphatase
MTTLAHHLPDAGSYVEMTASDEQAARVRVVHTGDAGLTLSTPLAAVPRVGSAVTLRWSAAPRGRYALPCAVVEVDENRVEVRPAGEAQVEQQRHFVRGGGGEQVILRRPDWLDAHGWIRDISEHSVRAHFEGTNVAPGEELQLWIQLGSEIVDLAATASRVAMLPQQVPPGPMSVEIVAVFDSDETQARVIRRYVMRQQLLSRTRA